MPLAINLVCTRCTDQNHIALRRWYADHVHLLLAAPELRQATLYRCRQPLAGQPPDYFCMYEFASLDDFLAFEHGEPKARATELTNAAAGRSSIEIVQRTQYERWLHRKWPAPAKKQGDAWRLAACFENEAGWQLDAQRWLADHLQALQGCTPLMGAQVFSSEGQAFMVLDFAGGDAAVIWQLLQDQLALPALYGQAQSIQIRWAANAVQWQAWAR
ncbi:MAG: hypothetical protein EAZ37_16385 [Burkholderiales bacterium]|nr:MAG: hypothetical protein EAZ37_16385 [Burkholderiales bacterium]